MGVVGLPSRVTGLAAISISDEMTFMPGCQASSNSSQYGLEVGVFWRLILMRTVLLAIILLRVISLSCVASVREDESSNRYQQNKAVNSDEFPAEVVVPLNAPHADHEPQNGQSDPKPWLFT